MVLWLVSSLRLVKNQSGGFIQISHQAPFTHRQLAKVNCDFQSCWGPKKTFLFFPEATTLHVPFFFSLIQNFNIFQTQWFPHWIWNPFRRFCKILPEIIQSQFPSLTTLENAHGPQHRRTKRHCFALSFPTQNSCSGSKKEKSATGLLKMENEEVGVRKVRRMRAKVKT